MSEISLAARWRGVVERDLGDYQQLLLQPTVAGSLFESASILRAYDFDHPLALKWATRAATELAQLLYQAKSFEQLMPHEAAADEATRRFLRLKRRAPIARDLAYAKATLDGAWDIDLLRDARATYVQALELPAGQQWSTPDQWRLHAAVSLALLTGDVSEAATLMKSKRSFRATQPMHDVLKTLVNTLVKHGDTLPPDGEAAHLLQRTYQTLRQPERDAAVNAYGQGVIELLCVQRFEFAVLRERYLLGQRGDIDWRRLYHAFSA